MGPKHLDRRTILKAATIGPGIAVASGAGHALAAPAVVTTPPEVHWRVQSSFPAQIDTIRGSAEEIARTIGVLTGGRFHIEIGEPGDFVPAEQTFDAVQSGTLQAQQTCSYYYIDRDPAFAFGSSLPFGLNARMQNAWITEGGGQHLLDSFYAHYDLVSFVAGNTGVQMGGWFRKEIRSLPEIAGLKMRIAGLGGTELERLGVQTQAMPIEAT